MIESWQRRTGSCSVNAHIGLSIRAGALRQHIMGYVVTHDAMPEGIQTVTVDGYPFVTPFRVNLDELRQ
jgi:hypothetical protein